MQSRIANLELALTDMEEYLEEFSEALVEQIEEKDTEYAEDEVDMDDYEQEYLADIVSPITSSPVTSSQISSNPITSSPVTSSQISSGSVTDSGTEKLVRLSDLLSSADSDTIGGGGEYSSGGDDSFFDTSSNPGAAKPTPVFVEDLEESDQLDSNFTASEIEALKGLLRKLTT